MKPDRMTFCAAALLIVSSLPFSGGCAENNSEQSREIRPVRGAIEKAVSVTAVVQPQNRLEMKPPVSGRIEQILVREGETVKTGQAVASMSSTERAALLDAAKSRGEREISYWEGIYKPITLVAPIDGTVIVSTMQPGQSVTQTDAVVVLSDRLIVQAQVDETDVGRVKQGQRARLSLDAYPDIEVEAAVSHIYHESSTVNNVTIYRVDLVPAEVPDVFRSGMTANARIIEREGREALLLPLEAVRRDKAGPSVLVKEKGKAQPVLRPVKLGISDETQVEVLSGLTEQDTVVVRTQKYRPQKSEGGTNPFVPQRKRESAPGR